MSFLLSFCVIFFVIFLSCFWVICFVISLSFVCHCLSFWERENGKNKSLKHDYHDRPFTSWQHQIQGTVQKLLESQPAVKKDRAGELALGNSFLGLPGRGVVSRPGVQGRLKNRVGGAGAGVKWPGGRGSGPRSGADLETPKTQLYQHASHVFCIFWHFFAFSLPFFLHFFCISQTRSHFFCIFFAFPRLGVIFFAFPKPGVIFCIFFGIS